MTMSTCQWRAVGCGLWRTVGYGLWRAVGYGLWRTTKCYCCTYLVLMLMLACPPHAGVPPTCWHAPSLCREHVGYWGLTAVSLTHALPCPALPCPVSGVV